MGRCCYYHAGCPDGFGAAWAVRNAWGEAASYVSRNHDDRLERGAHEGDEVAFVDIAPSNLELVNLCDETSMLHIVDHHVTARDRIEGDPEIASRLRATRHSVHFDLDASGAALAWRYWNPGQELPDLLGYVEDQDLWRFKLPDSREVNAAIASYPMRFSTWDRLANTDPERLAEEGRPIVHAQRLAVERAVATAHVVRVGEHRIEAVAANTLRPWIGHELATRAAHGVPCGIVYNADTKRVDVSIYSVGGFNVAELAAARGGGGHRSASGFSVPLDEWRSEYLRSSS